MLSIRKGRLNRTVAIFVLLACVVPYSDSHKTRRRRKAQALRGVAESNNEPNYLIPYDMMVKTESSKNKYVEQGEHEDDENLSTRTFKLHGKKEQKADENIPTRSPFGLQGKKEGKEIDEKEDADYPTVSPFRLQGKKRDKEESVEDDNWDEEYATMSPSIFQGKKREREEDKEKHEDYPTESPTRLHGKKRGDDDEGENNHIDTRPITRPSKSRKKKKINQDEYNREKHSKASTDKEYDDDKDEGYDNNTDKFSKKNKKDKNSDTKNDGDKDNGGGDTDESGDGNGNDDDDENPNNTGPTTVPRDPASRPTLSPTASLFPTTPVSRPGQTSSPFTATIEPTQSFEGMDEIPTQSPNQQPSSSTNTRDFALLDFVVTLAFPVNETSKLRDSMESIFYDGLLVDELEAVRFPLPQPTNQRSVAQGYGFEDGQISVREEEDITLEQVHEDQIRLLADVDFVEKALRQRMNDPDLMVLDLTLSEPPTEHTEDPSLSEEENDTRRRLWLIATLCSIACFILCALVVHRRYQIITQQKLGQIVPEQDSHEWKGPQTIEEDQDEEEEEEENGEESKEEDTSDPQDDYEPKPELETDSMEQSVVDDER